MLVLPEQCTFQGLLTSRVLIFVQAEAIQIEAQSGTRELAISLISVDWKCSISVQFGIHVVGNNVGAEGVYYLSRGLFSIESIELWKNPIGDEGGECTSRFRAVRKMGLHSIEITAAGISHMIRLSFVEYLGMCN